MTIENPKEADPMKGAKLFKERCAGCHPISKDMKHKIGPNLYGLWGRPASTVKNFHFVKGYPESEKKMGIIWDDASLFHYMSKIHIPGTKMRFAHMANNKEEKDLIVAYLKDATDPKKNP